MAFIFQELYVAMFVAFHINTRCQWFLFYCKYILHHGNNNQIAFLITNLMKYSYEKYVLQMHEYYALNFKKNHK